MYWNVLKQPVYEKWKKYWYDIHPHDVAEYSWDYLFNGGKEIRPKLFCELWNYLSPDSTIIAELAFAIECIHVASIILDDTPWMDNACERRGRTTLHKKFTPKKAVLITYELLDIARNIWLNNKPCHVSTDIWHALLQTKLRRLITGQWFDLDKKGDLIELASLKTGVLFELVSETVALCIGLDTEFWKIWGNNLGILFQWMDDWLDREQDNIENNRNAFNESYDITLKNYSYVWSKLVLGIGNDWFKRSFGIFMKTYFTDAFSKLDIHMEQHVNRCLLENISIPYNENIVIPEQCEYTLNNKNIDEYLHSFSFISGKDVVNKLYKITEKFFTIPSININLWNINENNWEESTNIKNIVNMHVM